MKLSQKLGPLGALRMAALPAIWPTLRAILRRPSLIFHPQILSRVFFSHLWKVMGDGIDNGAKEEKELLIGANAYGVVLDIGAGHGHTARYLDPLKVTRYVALEPNIDMHPMIAENARKAGFPDTRFQIISCGAEDVGQILLSLGQDRVDTLISILTLCSVPSPQATIRSLAEDILSPGGQLLFYEHVQNPKSAEARRWQRIWSPIWGLCFDHCALHRPTDRWIEELACWDKSLCRAWHSPRSIEEEEEEAFLWHVGGRFIKKSA